MSQSAVVTVLSSNRARPVLLRRRDPEVAAALSVPLQLSSLATFVASESVRLSRKASSSCSTVLLQNILHPQ